MRRIRAGSAPECPTERTLQVLGGGWKFAIIHFLFGKTRRYSELKRHLRGITPRMLAKQLRELERDGIVRRKVYAEVPPRVEYSLTPLGTSLRPVLQSMFDWGTQHLVRAGQPGR
jgi:DNA-binding HxlR family transcriptional regulator